MEFILHAIPFICALKPRNVFNATNNVIISSVGTSTLSW